MTVSKELLKILCCPVSKQPVSLLDQDRLRLLNELIAQRRIKDNEGNVVTDQISEALITADNKTIYRVDNDIPVMLIVNGIKAEQLK